MSTLGTAPATELTARIRERAQELGFDAVGFAPLGRSEHGDAYARWVEAGHAGEMGYLAREDAVAKRRDPSLVLPGGRSAVVVAKGYSGEAEQPDALHDPSRAIFARYARGDDYHEILKPRLIELQEWIGREVTPVGGRAYVDTGPVLERELAARAGLGWFGKNTMLIQPQRGSYYFLGVILLDVPLPADPPFEREHCGTCTRCLDGCPTGALLGRDASGAPRMDARRCISYLTIELKGPIPRELRPLIGNRIYGCDICQEVCPHNNTRFVQITSEEAFWPRQGVHGDRLIELMEMDQAEFARRFKNSPVKRAKRRGLLRNVAVALGNWGAPEAVPVLLAALQDDEPLIRGHAAWALGRIAFRSDCPPDAVSACIAAAERRLSGEKDEWVREELSLALGEISRNGESAPA
ncbi:MAG: tRNA epoxyqueuosine(34) reductase QueG [Gemmatimonadetes bacterium]|nr:tRNA epoxyqueuosine(34) reductase QueG [Gemmatimonadota bacterium]